MIRGLPLALVFLTRIPVPVSFRPSPKDWGNSVFFFPLVGLMIGLLMAALYGIFCHSDSGLVAVLLLTAAVVLTGGLHLDGLADTADAWIGGYGDREKTLAIMKDPHSGPIAIVVLVLVLLAKFAALRVAVEQQAWQIIVAVPVVGRSAMVLLLMTTPYVRPQGIGSAHSDYLPRRACLLMLLAIVAVSIWTLGWWDGGILVAVLGIGVVGLRLLLLQRLGGTTGDTLGASCELVETLALVTLVLGPVRA